MILNEEQEKNMLSIYGNYENYYRSLRKPILTAFDVYKTNIMYGIDAETEQEHNDIVDWYKQVLDLKQEAIDNVPPKIKRYMGV